MVVCALSSQIFAKESSVYSDMFLQEIQANYPDTLYCSSRSDSAPYYSLPLTRHDEKNINKIVSSLGEYNWVKLLVMKKELEHVGKKIEYLHPLRFIGYIFSNTYLTRCMKEVRGNRFKWGRFIGDFSQNMNSEARNNNLYQYVPGFCKEIQEDQNKVLNFIDRGDYSGLVQSLL